MKIKSQEQFYVEVIAGIGEFYIKGLEIHKFSKEYLRKDIPGDFGKLEKKPTGWIELRII